MGIKLDCQFLGGSQLMYGKLWKYNIWVLKWCLRGQSNQVMVLLYLSLSHRRINKLNCTRSQSLCVRGPWEIRTSSSFIGFLRRRKKRLWKDLSQSLDLTCPFVILVWTSSLETSTIPAGGLKTMPTDCIENTMEIYYCAWHVADIVNACHTNNCTPFYYSQPPTIK